MVNSNWVQPTTGLTATITRVPGKGPKPRWVVRATGGNLTAEQSFRLRRDAAACLTRYGFLERTVLGGDDKDEVVLTSIIVARRARKARRRRGFAIRGDATPAQMKSFQRALDVLRAAPDEDLVLREAVALLTTLVRR